MSANEQVRSEIQTFMQALISYPDRVARDPEVTFEDYCSSLMRATKSAPRRRA